MIFGRKIYIVAGILRGYYTSQWRGKQHDPPDDTKSALKYYFKDHVDRVRMLRELKTETPLQTIDCSVKFVEVIYRLLETLAKGNIVLSPTVGKSELQEILDVARSNDWTQTNTLRRLYEAHGRITREDYDMKKLFHGLPEEAYTRI